MLLTTQNHFSTAPSRQPKVFSSVRLSPGDLVRDHEEVAAEMREEAHQPDWPTEMAQAQPWKRVPERLLSVSRLASITKRFVDGHV